MKTLYALALSLFVVVGISGNNLWDYDMSNIIGNEEPVHITIDDGSSVSENEYIYDDSFDDLPQQGLIAKMKSLWKSFTNGFKRIVNFFRDGTTTVENYHLALQRLYSDIDDMTSGDTLGGVNFNPFIGMIRWVTDDLVFYEIFIILSIGILDCGDFFVHRF